jgi:hypothetical protein
MANKNNGDIGFFGEFNQFCRGGDSLDIGMKGLNRINDYNFGLDRFNLFEDVLGFGFGKDVAVVTGRGDSFCILFVLAFFAKHIKFIGYLVKFDSSVLFLFLVHRLIRLRTREQYRLKRFNSESVVSIRTS